MNWKFKLMTDLLIPVYGIQRVLVKMPKVKSIDETLDEIDHNHVSVSRYGDGEFDIIFGETLKFQRSDSELSKRLAEILTSNEDGHIVCIQDAFNDLQMLTKDSASWWRWYVIRKRKKIRKIIDCNKQYYNTSVTRPYRSMADKDKSKIYFECWQKIFENQDLLIIEGDKSRLGIGNDLFDKARSIKRILCPAENAFENYEQILNTAKKYSNGKLVLIALGPTATVLAYDLHKLGYWAIDLGHLDIEYEWYLRGIDYGSNGEEIRIEGKYTNEATNGNIVEECDDIDYKNQIIAKIGLK